MRTHVDNDVDSELSHVHDSLFVVGGYLSVMHESIKILIHNSILAEYVERYDTQFVEIVDSLVKENRRDVTHVVLDSFTLGVGPHCQVLKKNVDYYFWFGSKFVK